MIGLMAATRPASVIADTESLTAISRRRADAMAADISPWATAVSRAEAWFSALPLS